MGEARRRAVRSERRAGQVEAVGAVERFLGRAGETADGQDLTVS